MKTRKIIIGFLSLVLVLSFLSSIYAITGNIGNARMVLRVNPGDQIEKYISINNVNNQSVNIELAADGDLKNDINIIDKKFTLAAGESKKAYFTINVKKEGTTESKILITFAPVNGGNGVGLSSTVIVISGNGENSDTGDEVDSGVNSDNTNDSGNIIGDKTESGNSNINKKILFAIISTIVVFVIFLIILILYSIQKKKNKEYFEKKVKEKEEEIKEVKKEVKTKPKKSIKKK